MQAHSALLADIMPSGCRLSLMGEYDGDKPSFCQNVKLATKDFPSLEALLRHYIDHACREALPPVLGLSLAQPVTQDVIRLPAPEWTVDKTALKKEFGFKEVVFVNDTSSLASALLWLGPNDVKPIGQCNPDFKVSPEGGRYGVANISYGLGIASLVGENGKYTVVDSEGGHSAFAPQSDEQIEILKELLKHESRISNEMILSLRGLNRIYSAVCANNGDYDAKLTPLEILLYGKTGAEENCSKTINHYFDMLASIAGDAALNLCAVDGFLLSGDVLAKYADIMPRERFREIFQEKGAFREFVGRIPVYIITNPGARLIGLARVIFERLDAHQRHVEKLSEPETLLSEITSAIDQAIMIIGTDRRIIACSRQSWYNLPGAAELTTPGQLVDQYIYALADAGQFGLGERNSTADGIIEHFRKGENFEFTRTTFGGRNLRAKVTKRPGGGFIIVETDNTELYTRTKELEDLAASLREAKIKSDEASRAKSEFLANMSHEIRTPLNGVLGMADVLSKTPLETSQAEMLDVVIKSGNSLLTVINDILDFSKIEAGKLKLLQKPFDLRSTIEDVATMFSTQVEKNNVELMVRVAPELPQTVVGDAGRLRQVLTNIVGNAVKFTSDGHILIEATGELKEDHAEMNIAVHDTGCGIPKDKIDHIFEMFEQADGSSTRSHEGTGLGLTITSRILEAMNGCIEARSIIGEGSTFTIHVSLPVNEADLAAADSAYYHIDTEGVRVLIVDDQTVNRQILCEQTQSWGMEPLLASCGKEALQVLELEREAGRKIDIAILDFQMPGMDGLTLAKKIKANAANAGLPLILLTSVGHIGDAEEFVYEDFAGYLVKPARSALLLQNIRRALALGVQKIAPAAAKMTTDDAATIMPTPPVQCAEQAAAPTPRKQPAPVVAAPTPRVTPEPTPAPELRESQPVAAPAVETTPARPAATGKKIKVFVVEDNPVNRMVFSSMLQNPNYELIELDNGERAVSEFKRERPDLILMDISMPVLDGYAATEQIREAERESGVAEGVPIIGVTAHAMAEDRTKCLDSGMTDYLAKPIKQNDLQAVIKRYCA